MRVQSWKGDQAFILYDADELSSVSPALFRREHWHVQGLLEGSAVGRGEVAFIRRPEGQWVLRHYRRGGYAARWSEDQYLWLGLEQSRPWREFRITSRLYEEGLPVPRPVAACVQRDGFLYRGDFMTRRIPDARPLAEVLEDEALRPGEWRQLGQLLRRFHEAGVRHDDINVRNLLLDGERRFYLIDFDKARILPHGGWKERNILRLRRSLEKFRRQSSRFRFQAEDWAELLAGYDDRARRGAAG